MIKDEILQTKRKLARLKESYKKLIEDIKKTFYEKENYWDENSPRKPRNETDKMKAALCLAQGHSERYSFELNVRKAVHWKSRDEQTPLEYWIVNQKRFMSGGVTPATIIIHKKNIKLLREICRDLWVKEVGDSYRPNTLLGFEDWLETTDVDKVFELMIENLNENSERLHLVTDKNLYLKDIVVIFPKELPFNINNI